MYKNIEDQRAARRKYYYKYHARHLAQERAKRANPEYMQKKREIQWKWSEKVKAETFSAYGPKGEIRCSWPECVVIDVDMLTLDHIADDGSEQRKKGAKCGCMLYYKLREQGFPPGYQTLCMNHQWKKEISRRRKLCGKGNGQ